MECSNNNILLSAKDIAKYFGPVKALDGVDFTLRSGEVHALFGANGAGKSTLAKVITGHTSPTKGELFLQDKPISFAKPRDAIDAGISIVTQETTLADDLPVWENIVLPIYGAKQKMSRKAMQQKAFTAIDKLGFADEIPLDTICSQLSSAHRQLVEIARTVALGSKVIILDEPTAALSPGETARLFKVMDSLRAEGCGLIFVSHRLEEIFTITDRITVIRDGLGIANDLVTQDLTQAKLVQLMVGKEIASLSAQQPDESHYGSVSLTIENVSALPAVRDVNFDVRAGEIVGLGGLIGSGRSELAEVIMGLRPIEGGKMTLLGKGHKPRNPASAISAGLGFLPEDRRRQSIVPDFSVKENILLSHLGQLTGFSLNYNSHDERIHELCDLIELPRERLSDRSLLNFSGGMQQKALIIRSLLLEPKVLVLDEPTKGVDIGSRSTIYTLLRKLAAEGLAIVLISSDFEELLALSHRIVPISDGRTIGSVPASMIDEEQLILLSAPRSSVERQKELLKRASSEFSAEAAWLLQTGDRVMCLSSSGEQENSTLPMPGMPIPNAETSVAKALSTTTGQFITESNGQVSLLLPVNNQRGHDLGCIALLFTRGQQPNSVDDVVNLLKKCLDDLQEGQLRLVTTPSNNKELGQNNDK